MVEEPRSPKSPRVTMTAFEQRELLDRSKQSSTFGGASMIENRMELQSSASYNTDMFKGLDSISQTGDSRDITNEFDHLEQFDLGAVKYELQAREKKIKELLAEKSKMKALLKKAKVAVETINNKQKLTEQKLALVETEKGVLAKQLNELQKRRNGIEKG